MISYELDPDSDSEIESEGTSGAAAGKKLDELVKKQTELLTIPWLGFTASIGAYAIVLSLATDGLYTERLSTAVLIIAGLLACGLAAASIFVPKRLCSDARLSAHMRSEPKQDELESTLREDDRFEHARDIKGLPKLEKRLLGVALLHGRPLLVGLALANGVAVVGLLIGLAQRSLGAALPFLLLALGLCAVHFPRLSGPIERARKLSGPDEDMLEAARQIRDVRRSLKRR
jgi:hypothetical protein